MHRLKIWCIGCLVDTIYDSKRNCWILPAQRGLFVGQGDQPNSLIYADLKFAV